MLIGLNDSTRQGCAVRFKLLSWAERTGPRGSDSVGGLSEELVQRQAEQTERPGVRALADTLVPIGNSLQTVMGAWRLSGCPAHEWMPGVRRIARCANGHSAFEWVSDTQMDARPRNPVRRPARRNLAFPTWRDEICRTEDSLANISFFVPKNDFLAQICGCERFYEFRWL